MKLINFIKFMGEDIYLKIRRHNNHVEQELKKAERGEFISLSNLLIAKEEIIRKVNKLNLDKL